MNLESIIDKKYRELILQKYFNNPVLKGTSQCPKWVSPCPFCSSARKSESKRNEKVAALLWNETQRSWVFTCRRKACPHRTLSFPKLIERLNAELFLVYQQEHFHAGSTGFQTNLSSSSSNHCSEVIQTVSWWFWRVFWFSWQQQSKQQQIPSETNHHPRRTINKTIRTLCFS